MFSSRAAGHFLLFFSLTLESILTPGCRRRSPEPVQRLAIPPFENLSDDRSPGWAGVALSEAVATAINGSPRIRAVPSANQRDVRIGGATFLLQGYYSVAGGRIRLSVVREDLGSGRETGTFTGEEAFPSGVIRLAAAAAQWIDPGARRFDTQSIPALQAFAEGRLAEDPAAAQAAFESAIATDPDFGAPYTALAQSYLLRRDLPGFESTVGRARARGDKLAELRRAELELLASAASGNAAQRRVALLALNRAAPADADVLRQLAQMDGGNRQYDSAAQFYRRALELDPQDVASWNQLGYTEASRRNLDGARAALKEYERLAPKDPNASDSLGDVHYHLGAFGEAEKYYLDAYRKDPKFSGGLDLYKAARARLMTGDVAGADEIFTRYAEERTSGQGPGVAFLRAQWLHLTGRKAAGREQVMKLASSGTREIMWLPAAQLSAWSLESGDRQEAAHWAETSLGAAPGSADQSQAEMLLELSGAVTPRIIRTGDAAKQVLALRLLLDRKFAEAVAPLLDLAAKSNPMGSDRAPVWLAWALVETGKTTEASPLLATYGTPPTGFDDLFAGMSFPRVFQLRAAVLEQQGKREEAAKMRGIYQKLGGR